MAKTPDPLAKELEDLRTKARAARRLLEPGWFLDLAFYQGLQWVVWMGDRLHKPDLGPNRITVTENRIAGCVRTELAKMTKNRPVFVVTPNSGAEEDTNAAEMAERIMRYMWRHLKMPELSLKALEWSRVCCAGFLKCYWDSSIGDPVEVLVGPDGNVLTDEQGAVMRGDSQMAAVLSQAGMEVRSKRVAQGDVRVEVRSPFQMFVDPICDTFSEAEWVIEESVRSTDYVQRRFNVKLKADTPANPGMIEARMMGAMTGQAAGGYMGVRVREFWSKPSEKYPAGVRIVYAQDQILDRDDRPFDPMPYVMFTGIPVPGRLWPMSTVELLRGPQTELNKTISQMAENRNRIANPTGIASKQAIIDAEKFLDSIAAPGGWFFLDETGSQMPKPEYLESPELPEYVKEEPPRIVQAIEDISGQHEVTNANVPPGVTAASAITLLQEADDTRLGLAMQDYEEQLGRFGRKVLELVAHFYSEARTVKIAGDDGAWEIFDFKGTMLRGNTHVEVQAGSAFPQSQAAKQAQLTDYLRMIAQMGIQPTQRQLSQYLRDAGMGATDRLVQEYTTDEAQANRENALLAQGIPLDINPFDNNEAHLANHEDFEKQPRFQQLAPPIQQLHLQHTDAHRQRLQAQQQQQLEQELALQGQVPPNLTQAAYQAQQDLSQLQGHQQLQMDGLQAQQQQQSQAQQQGFDAAAAEQKQRQAEEAHHAEQRRQDELHQHKLAQFEQQRQHAAEQHEARIAQMRQQQAQQRSQGGQGGRRNAA